MKKQLDLLQGNIFTTLVKLAIPIMATALLQMAYNMVDMIWIGRIGSDAVAAVGSAGMYAWMASGFVLLAKVGGQVKVGHMLGASQEKEAVTYATTAFQMGIILGAVFGVLCLVFPKPLIGFFHLNSPVVINNAQIYLMITGGGIIFSFLNLIFTGIYTAMGNSSISFKISSVSLVINMVLDPVLIFGVGPFPRMEVAGAAVATLFAQMVSTVLFVYAASKDTLIYRKIRLRQPMHLAYVKEMLKISVPATVQNVFFAGMSMIIARLVAGWGDDAVAVQKVGSQIESISWMTADGFAAALGAFVAQNFGAHNKERVKKGYITAMGVVLVWGAFCTALLLLLPGPIFKVFIPDADILQKGITYLQILGFSQLFMCMEITTAGAFSGIGNTVPDSVVGVIFTGARIPLALLLSATALGISGIWWSITISSIIKGVIVTLWFVVVLRKIMGEKQNGN